MFHAEDQRTQRQGHDSILKGLFLKVPQDPSAYVSTQKLEIYLPPAI